MVALPIGILADTPRSAYKDIVQDLWVITGQQTAEILNLWKG